MRRAYFFNLLNTIIAKKFLMQVPYKEVLQFADYLLISRATKLLHACSIKNYDLVVKTENHFSLHCLNYLICNGRVTSHVFKQTMASRAPAQRNGFKYPILLIMLILFVSIIIFGRVY